MLTQKSKYNRMLQARVRQIEKKLNEIEGIKVTYGTLPSMTGVKEMRHQLLLWKFDLMD